jgi:hypothetical protein
MARSLFIHEDGQVSYLDVPTNLPFFRLVRRLPCYQATFDTSAPSISYVEYTRRGHTFDHTPVYVAPGFDVDEAYASVSYGPLDDADRIKGLLRSRVRRFVREKHPDYLVIDEKVDSPSLADASTGVAELRARLLVGFRPPSD